MKQKLLCIVLLLSVPMICLAQEDLNSFLSMKNIFDHDRTEIQAPKPTPTPQPVVEKLTLTGVLRYDQNEVAFFSGSRPEWSLPIEGGGIIAGMKLEKIDGSGAMLSGRFLPVGASFSKVGNGAWGLTSETQTFSSPAPAFTRSRRFAGGQGRRSSFTVSGRGATARQGRQMAKPEAVEVISPDPDADEVDWENFHDGAWAAFADPGAEWGMPPADGWNDNQSTDQ